MIIDNNIKQLVYDIVIVGAGPAGLAATITAFWKNNKQKILLIESKEKIGKSILKTGNGRCNLSNKFLFNNQKFELYNNENFVKKVFSNCNRQFKKYIKDSCSNYDIKKYKSAVQDFFTLLGLCTIADTDGRIFPYTKYAKTIVELFTNYIENNHIDYMLQRKFKTLDIINNKKIKIKLNTGNDIVSNKLIISTGRTTEIISYFKKSYTKMYYSLCPIATETRHISTLDGIKVHAKCFLYDKKGNLISAETGELLFRKYGISGICIFNLTRYIKNRKDLYVSIDFIPDKNVTELLIFLTKRYNFIKQYKQNVCINILLGGIIRKEISLCISQKYKISKNCIKIDELETIAHVLKDFRLQVFSIYEKTKSQVLQGGIDTRFISSKSLRYKQTNIYLAGEMIDIDGPCGGYNLHWAWMSGILAGLS